MTLADGAMAHAFRAMTPGPAGPVEAPPELKKVLSGVLCQCGCNLSVYDCEATMTCDVAKKMRADAERLLAQGMTSEQALGVFATNYGEDVLAAPTKEGFNLTAWVLPFAALAIGLVAVGVALRTWVPRRRTADGPEEETPPVDQRFVDAIERELGEEDSMGAAIGAFVLLLVVIYMALSPVLLRERDEEESEASTLLAEKARLLDAIRDLDLDLATGKLDDEDHRRLRARYIAEAADVERAIEEAAEVPTPTGVEDDAAPGPSIEDEIELEIAARRERLEEKG